MMLDTRFLRVHPRTRLWWAQRETCRTCAHYRQERSGERSCGMSMMDHCAAGRDGSGRLSACIDMRDEREACGTEAALFVMAEAVAT